MKEFKKQINTCDYPELAMEQYNSIIIEISGLIKSDALKKIIFSKYMINAST